MGNSLMKPSKGGILASKSVSGAAGKGMVVAGVGGILLTFLAALIPFVGIVGVSVILIALGIFLAE